MSTLREVLKDKQARRPLIKLGVFIIILTIFTFIIGFFAAFTFNVIYPKQSEYIYENLFKEETVLKKPIQPKV